jgi:uncharacterized membrane protein YesL
MFVYVLAGLCVAGAFAATVAVVALVAVATGGNIGG